MPEEPAVNFHKLVHEALIEAFPNHGALEQLVFFELNVRLEQIATGKNIPETVFEIMKWADAHGRLDELISGATKTNPDNPRILQIQQYLILQNKQAENSKSQSSLNSNPNDEDDVLFAVPQKKIVSSSPNISTVLSKGRETDEDDIMNGLFVEDKVNQRRHSIIYQCVLGTKRYILKGTLEKYCYYGALKSLVGKNLISREGSILASIGTPVHVWKAENYVWEIHPFYEGITLRELMLRSKYVFTGDLLAETYNSLALLLDRLHNLNILHRDISPSNILISGHDETVQLSIIDCSFCSKTFAAKKIPVHNPTYSPREQMRGRNFTQSDWYSLAATVFFLGTGVAPVWESREKFKRLLNSIDAGWNYSVDARFRSVDGDDSSNEWPEFGTLLESLLHPDFTKRPTDILHLVLDSQTTPKDDDPSIEVPITGILDMGENGYLVTKHESYYIVSNDGLSHYLDLQCFKNSQLEDYALSLV